VGYLRRSVSDDGYFRHESAIRRIGRESVLMLGGARALLMQAAHPLVAAGVAAHSDFRHDLWRRLARTLRAPPTVAARLRGSGGHATVGSWLDPAVRTPCGRRR